MTASASRIITPPFVSEPSVLANLPTAIVRKTEPKIGSLNLKVSHFNLPVVFVHFLKYINAAIIAIMETHPCTEVKIPFADLPSFDRSWPGRYSRKHPGCQTQEPSEFCRRTELSSTSYAEPLIHIQQNRIR